MSQQERLSNVTKDYLARFECILNEMIQGMTSAELSGSISYNFMVQMIPHHRAAIEMSRNILRFTTNIPLQEIALQIIKEQTKSIENMQAILCSCSTLENSRQDLCRYQCRMNQIMQTMFLKMQNARVSNEVNCSFMWEMIPHHQGAVAMSETTLQFCICPELRPILEAIISSQKRGIEQMEKLLKCLRCGSTFSACDCRNTSGGCNRGNIWK